MKTMNARRAAHPIYACLDASYRHGEATAAAVLFRAWTDDVPLRGCATRVSPIEPYIPGSFYRRELPCLLAVLALIREPLAAVVIDGYVGLSEKQRPGLGARLFDALGGRIPVLGVAKTLFRGSSWAVPIVRGKSRQPLYVTTAGTDLAAAANQVAAMQRPKQDSNALGTRGLAHSRTAGWFISLCVSMGCRLCSAAIGEPSATFGRTACRDLSMIEIKLPLNPLSWRVASLPDAGRRVRP